MAGYLNQKGIEKEMGRLDPWLSLAVKAPIKEAPSNKGGLVGKRKRFDYCLRA